MYSTWFEGKVCEKLKMAHLEGALELLRPLLVASETWEYCVVWRLSATVPLSALEWVSCCCVAGTDAESCMNSPITEDQKGFLVSAGFCRDSFNPHPATKKSCLALSQFPLFMPLQSEIYGEVIVSQQPRWMNLPDKLAPINFHETYGTHVLIPVLGGLVELFTSEQLMVNQEITDFVIGQFDGALEIDDPASRCTNSDGHYLQQSEFRDPMEDLLAGEFNSHPNFEGSSSWSIPSGHTSGCVSGNSSPNKEVMVQSSSVAIGKEICNVSPGEDMHKEMEKEQQLKSKNLHIERARRAKVVNRLYKLRSLVPKISKLNHAGTLDDAIGHILEMETKVKDLQEELEKLETDCSNNNATKSEAHESKKKVQFAANPCKLVEAKVEVNQLGTKEFMIKILCKAKVGTFTRILEALNHLGVQVTEFNAATCKGMASNSFVVQVANGKIQAGELKDALIKHACA